MQCSCCQFQSVLGLVEGILFIFEFFNTVLKWRGLDVYCSGERKTLIWSWKTHWKTLPNKVPMDKLGAIVPSCQWHLEHSEIHPLTTRTQGPVRRVLTSGWDRQFLLLAICGVKLVVQSLDEMSCPQLCLFIGAEQKFAASERTWGKKTELFRGGGKRWSSLMLSEWFCFSAC